MNIHGNLQTTPRMLTMMAVLALSFGSLNWVRAANTQAGRQSQEPAHPVLRRAGRERVEAQAPARGEEAATVPAGRFIHLRLEDSLSSRTSRVGDRFAATIVEPVRVNGRVALPEGTRVIGRVTYVRRARRRSKPGNLGVDFVSIKLPSGEYDVVASLASLDESENERMNEEGSIKGGSSKKRNTVFIGGGAGVGTAIGAIGGGGSGAAIGAGTGAAIGIAGALLSKGKEVELNPGAEFGMRLERDLVVPVEARRTR